MNPSVGTTGVDIQCLASVDRGKLLGGRRSLYAIDLTTGVPSLMGAGIYNDLRGLEDRHGVHHPFGQACNGVSLSITGNASPGSTIDVSVTGQRRNAPGTLFLGFSDSEYQGVPLPLLLDGFLGTNLCFLYSGSDLVFPTAANGLGVATVSIAVPRSSPKVWCSTCSTSRQALPRVVWPSPTAGACGYASERPACRRSLRQITSSASGGGAASIRHQSAPHTPGAGAR